MNKKLLAVAVAGALALPGVALAQSSVTISGFLKMSFGQLKISDFSVARAAGANSSETRLTDDSSRIQFNVVEDLGGGLRAIAQIDWRVAPDSAADGGGPTGNNHVGLQSSSWGRLFVGRQDLHYFNRESNLTAKGDLKADSISLLAFIQGAPVAGATRIPNVVHYTTPNWGGFTAILAYSTNPGGATEADIGVATRKGSAVNFNPNLRGANYQVGYSYWRAKPDGGGTDQRADRLYGSYTWGGLMVGLAWDKSKFTASATGVETANRTAWSLPVQYTWGPHGIYGHYTKAKDDSRTVAQDGAKMFAISYQYDLSKRTSMAINYAKITNEAGASYNLFTSAAATIGSPSGGVLAGEDPRMITATLRHAF